ncbi:MAG TPA: CocE/NonD family hydrolase [Thermoanaerobaculia bacterium]|nr:CocE/NonD family hydrolase [Thermoanaerobaculia bacterium]
MSARVACVVLTGLFFASTLIAQEIEFPRGAAPEEALPALAARILDTDAAPDPDNRFRLQLVAGRYAEAVKTLGEVRGVANVRWEIYARAKGLEAEGTAFDEAFRQSFRERMGALDDQTAYRVGWSFGTALVVLERGLRDALTRHQSATALSAADATDLIRRFLGVQAYRSFQPLLPALLDEDQQRRYVIAKDVPVKTPSGATVCALIVRPRVADRRLPSILNFTIYADPDNNFNEALRTASNGYAGIVGLPRGKGCSPDKPVPYEHDADDASALIDWIAAQSWSDGRAGMYGGSYEGAAAWAAAKRMPRALKGIMTGAPVGPGIDVPMEGNVFWSFVYPWPFYTLNDKALDNATYNDSARWQRLDREWYSSGRAYRDLEKIDKTPNPVFAKWLAHPSYDAYWRAMIPQEKEFARIGIPVLTTAGYYYGGPGAAVHYFREHYKYRPNAEHYLVIGPWDHVRGHSGTLNVLGTKTMTSLAGYDLEPAAHIDMAELRYRWFDYVFGKGPRPAILADKVNYMVVGADTWKHAPSLSAMSGRPARFYLTAARTLSQSKPPAEESIPLTVDLADRSDVDREVPGGGVLDKAVDTANGLQFVSDPFNTPAEISGLFSGHLDFIANKKDFDFSVELYELTTAGEYVLLAPYWSRASYAGHPGRRRLLTPGKRHRLDFEALRLMSRRLQPGSRIVAVLRVIKEAGRQINYGTGKDVSAETIADAGAPLEIRWLTGSYLALPIR